MGAPFVYLPEQFKVVTATKITTTNATVTFDNVSMKNAIAVWLVADYNQAASHATVITPKLGAVVATGTTPQLIVARFDPAQCIAQNSTFDCIGGTIATSSQATNYVSAKWFLEMKYAQAPPPAAITD